MEDENFGYECCFTCQYCVLDIQINAYICMLNQQTLSSKSNRYIINKPNQCKKWYNGKEIQLHKE